MVPCGVWDWSDVKQAQSNFYVQQGIKDDGVDSWWLDWCCDGWINHPYAQSMINAGERGFVTSRAGSSFEANQPAGQSGWAGKYVTGPWTDQRSAIHFTGDTHGTWSTLAYEAQLTPDEASVGLPYVSHDIGSFSGPPSDGSGPRTSKDPDDLYLRWLQMGVFQPIMRLHSTRGGRLPWEYDAPTQRIGDSLMQLRSQLVPYLYNLAHDTTQAGLPMTRALYLNYPNSKEAYSFPDEYLLGDDMLVAPVTTPGTVAKRTMWFPPGTWTDWFTGRSFRGPVRKTLEVPLDRTPVFVRAGGVVPLAPSNGRADQVGSAPLTLRVYPGTGKLQPLPRRGARPRLPAWPVRQHYDQNRIRQPRRPPRQEDTQQQRHHRPRGQLLRRPAVNPIDHRANDGSDAAYHAAARRSSSPS